MRYRILDQHGLNSAPLTTDHQPGTPSTNSQLPSVPEFTFFVYDHLGNTRVMYHNDMYDCQPFHTHYVLEHVLDYFPYGRTLREYLVDRERFETTYHERDIESGLDYRGARFYDGDVGRFLSTDPLAIKFADWSTYNYVLGNPVMFIDPDGRQIDVEYGEGKSFTYEANMSYEDWASKNGENEFVRNTITALNYMYRDEKKNAIFAAMSLKDIVTIFEVTEFGSGQTQFTGKGGGFGGLKNARIGFNPYEAVEIMSDDQAKAYVEAKDNSPNASMQELEQMKQLIGGTGSVQSPALGLGHELGHFVNASKSWQSYQNRDKVGTASEIWRKSSEEKYNVNNWETPLAKNLGEPIRTNAAAISRQVSSPLEFINKQ